MPKYECSHCGELPHWAACVEAGRRLKAFSPFSEERHRAFRAIVIELSPSYCPTLVLNRLAIETGVSVATLAGLVA